MGYDKNTVILSRLSAVRDVLAELGETFEWHVIGKVSGCGVNDVGGGIHMLCRLEYRDKVILERIERTYDCDSDDEIVSYTFRKCDEPKEWQLEIWTDEP